MKGLSLFRVQDDERPMYVLAADWAAALSIWQARIRHENEHDGECDPQPSGIELAAPNDSEDFPEILVPKAILEKVQVFDEHWVPVADFVQTNRLALGIKAGQSISTWLVDHLKGLVEEAR